MEGMNGSRRMYGSGGMRLLTSFWSGIMDHGWDQRLPIVDTESYCRSDEVRIFETWQDIRDGLTTTYKVWRSLGAARKRRVSFHVMGNT